MTEVTPAEISENVLELEKKKLAGISKSASSNQNKASKKSHSYRWHQEAWGIAGEIYTVRSTWDIQRCHPPELQ